MNMRIHSKRIMASLCAAAVMAAPVIALGATTTGGLVPCGNPGQPACDFNGLVNLVNGIINWFLGISVSVAAITFAIAGGKILLNPGNESKISEGREMLWKTIIGIVIILIAWLVMHTVISYLTPTSSSNTIGPLHFLGG